MKDAVLYFFLLLESSSIEPFGLFPEVLIKMPVRLVRRCSVTLLWLACDAWIKLLLLSSRERRLRVDSVPEIFRNAAFTAFFGVSWPLPRILDSLVITLFLWFIVFAYIDGTIKYRASSIVQTFELIKVFRWAIILTVSFDTSALVGVAQENVAGIPLVLIAAKRR